MFPQKQFVEHGGKLYDYVTFGSVTQFNNFVDRQIERLSPSNAATVQNMTARTESEVESGSDWYGTPAPRNMQELVAHNSFLGIELVKELRPIIKRHLSKYLELLEENVMPRPKVEYNDRGLGVFSFDRAAMGLHDVQRINMATPIDGAISQLNVALGRTSKATTMTTVYAHRTNKGTSWPALRLYVSSGGNANISGDEMLYCGLACAELIDFLEVRGVPVEVNVIYSTSFDQTYNHGIVRLKRFEDKADLNKLLLLSADPRFYRYRGFKAIIALVDYFGRTIPAGLGRDEENAGKSFISALGEDGLVFEQSYSLNDAAQEVVKIVETYTKRRNNAKETK
jgi:hypothetical protein